MRAAAQRVFPTVVPIVFLGFLPMLVTVVALWAADSHDVVSIDFHNELYLQAKDVLDGDNPYPPPDADLSSGANAIWPIAAVLAVTPLAALPASVADWVVAALELVFLVGALLLVGVRDWRVYGAALLWPPVINAIQTGNATLPLAVLCALAWRYRASRLIPAVAIGVGLALKFFIWPLVLWLVCIRRYTAAALAASIGAISLALILPFDSIQNYVSLVQNLAREFDDDSYTLYGMLVELGAPSPLARVVWLVSGLLVLGFAWRTKSFALAIGAALLLSPIVWLHFFALLLVPLAIAYPTYSAVWLIPLPMWLTPGTLNGRPWQTAVVLSCFAGLLVVCARGERSGTATPTAVFSPVEEGT